MVDQALAAQAPEGASDAETAAARSVAAARQAVSCAALLSPDPDRPRPA